MTNPDKKLIKDYIESNKNEALGQLWSKYEKHFYAVAYRKVQNRTIVQDLLQDSFIRIKKSLDAGKFDGINFKSWASVIISNICIDYHRSKKSNPSRPYQGDSVDNWVHPETDISLEDKIIEEEKWIHNKAALESLLETISPAQRKVIYMRMVQDMKFKEISEQLDIKLVTSICQMRYGLINLRKSIAKNQITLEA